MAERRAVVKGAPVVRQKYVRHISLFSSENTSQCRSSTYVCFGSFDCCSGYLKASVAAEEDRHGCRILRTIHSHPPSQTWQTFLRNHLGQIVGVDFFTVPTIRLRVLFVFLVLKDSQMGCTADGGGIR